MRISIILLTFISLSFTMCNTTFLNHKDYEFKEKDFVWNIKVEGIVDVCGKQSGLAKRSKIEKHLIAHVNGAPFAIHESNRHGEVARRV